MTEDDALLPVERRPSDSTDDAYANDVISTDTRQAISAVKFIAAHLRNEDDYAEVWCPCQSMLDYSTHAIRIHRLLERRAINSPMRVSTLFGVLAV